MSDNEQIPIVDDADVKATNENVDSVDQRNAESEDTGRVPRSEVDELKDSLGGGQTLDNDSGIQTRHAKVDALKQERNVDNLDLGDTEEASKSSVAQ